MRPDTLTIIGLGAVGSTLARHAREAGVARVVGYTGSRGEAVRALKTNAVDHLAERLEDAVREAQVVIVAQTVSAASITLSKFGPVLAEGSWVTTVGSLVIPLAQIARERGLASRWAASHHLGLPEVGAGRDLDPKVLPGAVTYVSPAGPEGETAAREVMDLWETVFGAHPVLISPEEHDERLGWLVHLPVALAAALGASYGARGLGAVAWGVEAREATEFGGDPAGQAAALVANKEVLLAALDGMTGAMRQMRAALQAGDIEGMTRLLEAARRTRRGSSR
jgi:prephenate dehydrogenase